jgi:hypothetical protein
MTTLFSVSVADTIVRLEDSLETIAAFAEGLPAQYTHALPAGWTHDAWTVATNLAHMAVYEEMLAAPVLEAMGAGDDGSAAAPSGAEDWFGRETGEAARLSISVLVGRLRVARQRQIEAIRTMTEERFNEPVCMLWSARRGADPRAASWVATKTFQHAWEHGNAILRVALWAPR